MSKTKSGARPTAQTTGVKKSDIKLGNLAEAAEYDVQRIPITLYSLNSDALPIPGETLQNDYGLVIDPLQVLPTNANGVGRVTSLVRSQTVEEFILATHVGVVVIPEPKLFALNGVDTAKPPQPTVSPQFDGFVPPNGIITGFDGQNPVRDTSARPAQFVWGHNTYKAAWAALQAYDLRFRIARFEVFRELAANVGACISGNFRGFSSTKTSPIPYIRAQNNLMANIREGERLFLPQTVTAGQGELGPTPAQPPLVDVAYGGINLSGAFGGWYPIDGLLLAPGMPINLLLERTAGDDGPTSYHERMLQELGSTQDFQTYSDRFLAEVAGNVGFAGASIWKGGLFRIGILVRGFSLAPLACWQAYQSMSRYFNPAEKALMYRDSASVMLGMLGDIEKTPHYGAIKVGGRSLQDEVAKKGYKLAGLSDIDVMDFGGLVLPAP